MNYSCFKYTDETENKNILKDTSTITLKLKITSKFYVKYILKLHKYVAKIKK